MTTVWIVGQVKDPAAGDWELGGVFSNRERALAACVHPDDCIWEETVDKAYPRETSVPPDLRWPMREPR